MNVNEITLSNTPKSSNNSQGAFAAKSGGRRWLSCLRTAQDGGRRRAAAEGIASPPDASRILHEVYEEAGKMRRGSGRVLKADEIASIIDRRADRPVPDRLYRGQTGSGITARSTGRGRMRRTATSLPSSPTQAATAAPSKAERRPSP